MQRIIMLSFIYAMCHVRALYSKYPYAGCRYAVCRYAECRGPLSFW
jgi:hypothetical protein